MRRRDHRGVITHRSAEPLLPAVVLRDDSIEDWAAEELAQQNRGDERGVLGGARAVWLGARAGKADGLTGFVVLRVDVAPNVAHAGVDGDVTHEVVRAILLRRAAFAERVA